MGQLGDAFHNYHEVYNSFPTYAYGSNISPTGYPYLSWRVYLLPFLGYTNLFNQFHLNESWDSPHNLSLLDEMPEIYRSRDLPVGTNLTGFQVLAGVDAYYQAQLTDSTVHPDSTVHGPSLAQNTDGGESTLLVLETQASQAVEWTRPDGDIPFDLAHPLDNIDLTGLKNVPADGLLALMVDGSVRNIRPSISAQDFAALATWKQGEVIDASQQSRSFFDVGGTIFPSFNEFNDGFLALRYIGLALHSFHDIFGGFPVRSDAPSYFDASGNPNLSWRVHLLPFLGEQNLYFQFHLDEPWNSPHNLPLLDKMPEIFLSRGLSAGTNLTGFQFVSGPEAYLNDSTHSPDIDDVLDGIAYTIGVIETPPELAVPWSKPDDFPFNPSDPFGSIRALIGDFITVMMLDGSALAIAPQIDPDTAAAMMTWAGGDPYFYDSRSLTPQIQLTDSSSILFRIETDVADLGSTTYPAELLKTFTIKNTGSQPLVISSVQLPDGFTLVTPLNTIAPGASAPFTIRLDGSVGGNFGGLVTINSNVPDQPSLKFTIEGTVDSPLSLALSNSSIGENLPAGTVVGTFSTTDPNPGGTFLYSLVSGIGSNDNSLFTIDSAGRLKPSISFDYEAHSTYSIRTRTTREGGGPALEQTFIVSVIDLNEAPLLNNAGTPTLDSIRSNMPPQANPGTLVSDIIARMAPNGGITDPDAGNLQGIAINGLIGAATGTWQFSIDGGAVWSNINTTGNFDARLLAADTLTRIRYVPNPGFIGEVKIAFVAWDRSSGVNGGVVSVNNRGSSTPYSLNYEYASLVVLPPVPSSIGVWRAGKFYLDANANFTWNNTAGGDQFFSFGSTSDTPLVGDWNGDGITDIGVWRSGKFYLDANGNHIWNNAAGGDALISFGSTTDLPISGDWNGDGKTDIGTFRAGKFYLDANGNGKWDGTTGGDQYVSFGTTGDLPVIGDWNGDGISDIGIFRNGRFYLDANGNRIWNNIAGGDTYFNFGTSGDKPVAGDWNGDGKFDVGVVRMGTFYLDANGNRAWNNTTGGDLKFTFGSATDIPLVGIWQLPSSAPLPAGSLPPTSLDVNFSLTTVPPSMTPIPNRQPDDATLASLLTPTRRKSPL
ncbi:MAG: DUF1559 domain-containing protein [Planctomycetaceae bacterium]|nr:DUF1559 domain-containing protein [Planctomycetaceae bacterium]